MIFKISKKTINKFIIKGGINLQVLLMPMCFIVLLSNF